MQEQVIIKAIIGLGNPGSKFQLHRHNIGFLVLDALADMYHGQWSTKGNLEYATIQINNKPVTLIKPQTFMNDSGKVTSFLQQKGIKQEELCVVHDELEKPFGKLAIRQGGSARGHNGLRSLIAQFGKEFWRLRFGIGRPEQKVDVANYVLSNFSEPSDQLEAHIQEACQLIEDLFED